MGNHLKAKAANIWVNRVLHSPEINTYVRADIALIFELLGLIAVNLSITALE
jgi:hypothetical protein